MPCFDYPKQIYQMELLASACIKMKPKRTVLCSSVPSSIPADLWRERIQSYTHTLTYSIYNLSECIHYSQIKDKLLRECEKRKRL